jgi:hypothetical protein
MPDRPREIWGSLSPQIRIQVVEEMSMILMEVIDEKLGAGNVPTLGSQGREANDLSLLVTGFLRHVLRI